MIRIFIKTDFSLKQLAFFFCITVSVSFGQKNKIDSLNKLLSGSIEDTVRVRYLNMLSWSQKSIGEYDQSRESADRALVLSEKIGFRKGIADALNMKGVAWVEQGNYSRALEFYQRSLEISREINDKRGLASAYNNIALIHYNVGSFGKALENFELAVKLNKETGNKRWLANNYNNIGNVYADKKEEDLALENYLRAKKIKTAIEQTADPQFANIENNIGNIYFSKQQYVLAMDYFNNALKIRNRIGDKRGLATSGVSIGSVFLELMKSEKDSLKRDTLYKKALANFNDARALYLEIGDEFGNAFLALNFGSVYILNKNTQAARKELTVALEAFKEMNANDFSKDVCQLLSQCDSIDGNWKGAYEYHRLYKQFSDSIFSEENSRKLAEMTTLFETQKKEERIGQLESERNKTRLFIIVFLVLLVVLLVVGKRAYDNKKKIAEFMKTENERKEVLIQEVHHRINNNLQIISSLLTLQAGSANDEKLNEYLKESQNRIQSLSSLHELLYQADSPLKVNIREYFEKILDFHRNVLPDNIILKTEIANVGFGTRTAVSLALIVNEVITNSLKHAFAGSQGGIISIVLQRAEGSEVNWLLRISDSGKGLPLKTEERRKSLGLRLVSIMTRQLGGDLKVYNNPGATFDVTFCPDT